MLTKPESVIAAMRDGQIIDASKLTRVTLVDDRRGGRVYEARDLRVELSVQDNGTTLKIFVYPSGGDQPTLTEQRLDEALAAAKQFIEQR